MNKQPLLVHLIFHPQSESARDLARYIYQQLNGDIIVPGPASTDHFLSCKR
jgi:hypothetical protein